MRGAVSYLPMALSQVNKGIMWEGGPLQPAVSRNPREGGIFPGAHGSGTVQHCSNQRPFLPAKSSVQPLWALYVPPTRPQSLVAHPFAPRRQAKGTQTVDG